MVVLITDRIYVVAERINFITITEEIKDIPSRDSIFYTKYFTLRVNFIPIVSTSIYATSNSGSKDDSIECEVFSHREVTSLFRDIVQQIREQAPDQLFLDKAMESILKKELPDDTSSTEICTVGEKKRRNKKVLRRSKPRIKRTR